MGRIASYSKKAREFRLANGVWVTVCFTYIVKEENINEENNTEYMEPEEELSIEKVPILRQFFERLLKEEKKKPKMNLYN